eukprot:1159322-Pelagomonas_calceolata.AAC.7
MQLLWFKSAARAWFGGALALPPQCRCPCFPSLVHAKLKLVQRCPCFASSVRAKLKLVQSCPCFASSVRARLKLVRVVCVSDVFGAEGLVNHGYQTCESRCIFIVTL